VTSEQITRWNLPTRPIKKSDCRSKKFKGPSVEVDAIAPDNLRALVTGSPVASEIRDRMQMVTQSYSGLQSMAQKLQRKAKAAGKELPGGPVAALLTLPQGRLALAAIRDIAQRLVVERREFGLSPSSRVRVTADGGGMDADDEILDAVFNQKAERLVPPKLN
jgi:hypothetical protein